jgi:murein DD-endopeptidase MepM/ murein hydrolase activator NlpD
MHTLKPIFRSFSPTGAARLWVCTAIALSACSSHAAPKPVPAAKVIAPIPAAAPPSAEPEPPPVVIHTLAVGETLWDVARAYGVSTKQIIEQNGIVSRDPRRLRAGTQLKLTGVSKVVTVETATDRASQHKPLPELKDGAYHMLRHGESLWTLARMYDVPMDSIMARNGFSEDIHGQLQIGQPIIIPGLKASQIKQSEPEPVRKNGMVHEITRGETVWDIAHTFGVSVAEVMAANNLSADAVQNIREGQTLILPGVEDDGRGHVHRATSAREGRAGATAKQLGLGSLMAAGLLLHGRVEPRWIAAAGGGGTMPGTLRWPVAQGWFVRGFGSGQGGYHKAMDIMGKIGWNVRAAAGGIVGYAGDKVPGFGNMIMVVHPAGWVTLYAHNSVNFVSAGERVQKGSVLAEVGSTGRSTGPHVHFELIYDGKNCDPAPLFRPGVRHRSGKFASIEYTTWSAASKRPKAVQCAPRQKHPVSVLSENPVVDAQKVDERNEREAPAPDDFGGLIGDILREPQPAAPAAQ